ncbi:MAG: tRNA (adenosine(37)-N6)-threonylcarbamoyltransferase complex dimerization subunit type 1 TsaB [Burkholderiales bacterium]|nr:tRNA (adenosine(37)-N6)-threonylcarbamoyltransferase complex dimerization subunit type 1 TsaB [Burkholderiales bacterium]
MSVGHPVLIALDTATDRVHVALVSGDQTRVAELAGGAQASATLLPSLNDLLAQAGLRWADVDAIAFGEGPGAFTGLRTACSTAQGLALGLDKPVIAVDTLMAVAEDARQSDPSAWPDGDVVWVLQDARMDEMYVAAFAWRDESWTCVHLPQLWPLDEPARRWARTDEAIPSATMAPRHLAGSGLKVYPDRFVDIAAPHVWPQAAPRGAALAALAHQAWLRGDTIDAALALPRYVRDKVAQTTAERLAARS